MSGQRYAKAVFETGLGHLGFVVDKVPSIQPTDPYSSSSEAGTIEQ
jgi:hypothetical protein